ncbi:MAG: carboxypeptidase-like regulatory domain-containing protein [Chloroflexota bacterium]
MNTRTSALCLLVIASTLWSACSPKATPVPTPTVPPPPTSSPTAVPPTATSAPLMGKITGRVYIFHSDKSLAGAVVTLSDPAIKEPVLQAIADEAGQYVLEGIEPGTYSLSIMWEFKDRADCPSSNMFAPITLFQKEDGTFILIMTALTQFEVMAGDAKEYNIRVLCQ